MKYLAAALVVLGLIAADFLAHVPTLDLSQGQQDAWQAWDTVGLVGFAILIAFGTNRG